MNTMKEFVEKITEVTDKSKNEVDPQEKELLHKEFWLLAVDAFNENIAGEVTLANGSKVTTPPIEI